MSHFSVLVIGSNVKEQLQPYHEFECTGTDDQYVQDVDITEMARAEYERSDKENTFVNFLKDWYGCEVIGADEEPDLSKKHKYGWIRAENGFVSEVIQRTNPNKHWDWWVEGGRWGGFLRLKNGKEADISRKGHVDWERMKDEAGKEAGESWDLVHSVIRGRSFLSWEEMREAHKEDIDEARKSYWAQDVLRDLQKDDKAGWVQPEDYRVTREEYVENARLAAIATFAVVKDGQWYEKGSMGWWGVVSDEKDQGEWNRQYAELLDGLPDDTLLTVVDCHI